MTDNTSADTETESSPFSRYVPLAIYAVVLLTFLCIPLKIVGLGYLPTDDALRHAAKAVSGKPWQEILVLNPDYKVDHNYGWHVFLTQVYQRTHCETEDLVIMSVVLLYALLGWVAVPWLRRPEAWLVAMLVMVLCTGNFLRFFIGRPFLISIFVLLTVLFVSQRRGAKEPGWGMGLGLTALLAAAVFVHGVWYLWVLPLAAFVLARQYRWALVFGLSWVAGTVLGAALTGHPVDYIVGAVDMAAKALTAHTTKRTEVGEFQPSTGDFAALVVLGGLIILRQLAKLDVRPLLLNPAFWLVCMDWILGFKAMRFWSDWGWPALLFLVACDLDALFRARIKADSLQRLGLTCGLALATYMATTNDIGSRWTSTLVASYLTKEDPEVAEWLPDTGGILYSASMTTFYSTFYKNPHGDWRYMLGYEPAIMPSEDFHTYHRILWNFGDNQAYQPWVDKMRPIDRLVINGGRASQPGIAGLEWHYAVSGVWVGRLPRTNSAAISTNLPASP